MNYPFPNPNPFLKTQHLDINQFRKQSIKRHRTKSTDYTATGYYQKDCHKKLHLRDFDYGKLDVPSWVKICDQDSVLKTELTQIITHTRKNRESLNQINVNSSKVRQYCGLSGCTTARESSQNQTHRSFYKNDLCNENKDKNENESQKPVDTLFPAKVNNEKEKEKFKIKLRRQSYQQYANYKNLNVNDSIEKEHNSSNLFQTNNTSECSSVQKKKSIVKHLKQPKQLKEIQPRDGSCQNHNPNISRRLSLNIKKLQPEPQGKKIESMIKTKLQDKTIITNIINKYQNTKVKILKK